MENAEFFFLANAQQPNRELIFIQLSKQCCWIVKNLCIVHRWVKMTPISLSFSLQISCVLSPSYCILWKQKEQIIAKDCI